MRLNKFYIIAFLLLVVLTTCRKKEKPAGEVPDETIPNITVLLNTQQGAAFKYQEVFKVNKDTLLALIEMGKWLIAQPDVAEAYITDQSNVEVHFTSGLVSNISIVATDANGRHLTRGNGSMKESGYTNLSEIGAGLKRGGSGDNHKIGNNKVLVFIPFFEEFYKSNYHLLPRFSLNPGLQLDVTLVTGLNANLNVINSFSDYGLIVINTHGRVNGFEILPKAEELSLPKPAAGEQYTKEQVIEMFVEGNNLPPEKLENGELVFNAILSPKDDGTVTVFFSILVTEKYIRNMPRLKDAVVLGNFCFSGYVADGPFKNNTSEAFKSIGAVSYYGYAKQTGRSEGVSDDFAKTMEDSFITNLVKDTDSTGIAHLANNVTLQYESIYMNMLSESEKIGAQLNMAEFIKRHPPKFDYLYFKHYFEDGYKYDDCGTFTDKRDQQVYKLACIGKQQWFAENLRYNAAGSTYYNNNAANLATYGRMYTWATLMNGATTSSATPSGVQGICPVGWHVPSKAEWLILINELGGLVAAGGVMKSTGTEWTSPNTGATNGKGFTALPGGLGDGTGGFSDLGLKANFWTTTEFDATFVYPVTLTNTSAGITENAGRKTKEMSCRCVKD